MKPTNHEREFYDTAFDVIYANDENFRRVSLFGLFKFILPAITQAQQELNTFIINTQPNKFGATMPTPTTGMDMLEKIIKYISEFKQEVELYERTRGKT